MRPSGQPLVLTARQRELRDGDFQARRGAKGEATKDAGQAMERATFAQGRLADTPKEADMAVEKASKARELSGKAGWGQQPHQARMKQQADQEFDAAAGVGERVIASVEAASEAIKQSTSTALRAVEALQVLAAPQEAAKHGAKLEKARELAKGAEVAVQRGAGGVSTAKSRLHAARDTRDMPGLGSACMALRAVVAQVSSAASSAHQTAVIANEVCNATARDRPGGASADGKESSLAPLPGPPRDPLPVDDAREEIVRTVKERPVVCIHGETGCGKSTRVPQFVHCHCRGAAAYLRGGEGEKVILCVHSQRLGVVSLARRVAAEMGEKSGCGGLVGYEVPGGTVADPKKTRILFTTAAHLVRILVDSPSRVSRFSHLIMDDCHARSLDTDTLAMVLRLFLQHKVADFKIIMMSSSVEGLAYQKYFQDSVAAAAPVPCIHAGESCFGHEVRYLEDLTALGSAAGKGDGGGAILDELRHDSGLSLTATGRRVLNQGLESLRELTQKAAMPRGADPVADLASKGLLGAGSEGILWKASPELVPSGAGYSSPHVFARAHLQKDFEILVMELVRILGRGGEKVLIIMPGAEEVDQIQEVLQILEASTSEQVAAGVPQGRRGACKYRVVTLQARDDGEPVGEEEEEAFREPPKDVCHVLVTAEAAESSVTLPMVRVVIDLCLRRGAVPDRTRRGLGLGATRWASQATSALRSARTGRTCPGVCIRLMPRQLHEVMPRYEAPEIEQAPLERLCLRLRQLAQRLKEQVPRLGQMLGQSPTAAQLMETLVQPPTEERLEEVRASLVECGALNSTSDERASMTVLGQLALAVPLDLRLCRLILFGALFGCLADAVVMATALSLQDPLARPVGGLACDRSKYIQACRAAALARRRFDGGSLCEPVMLRNVFVAWLRELWSSEGGAGSAQGAAALRQMYASRSQSFAEEHAAVPARLVELAGAVAGTAFRVLQLLPPAGAKGSAPDGGCAEGRGALVALLARLGALPPAASLLEHVGAGAAAAPGPQMGEEVRAASKGGLTALESIFSEDPLLLKVTLTASFSPLFAHGVLRCVDYQPSVAGPPQKPGDPATAAIIKAEPTVAAVHAQTLSQASLADPGPRRCACVPGAGGASKLESDRLKQMAAPLKDAKGQLEKVEVLKDGAYLLFEQDDGCESEADSARSQGDDPVRPPESLVAEVEEEEEAAAREQAAKEQAAKEQEEKAARERAAEEAKKVGDSKGEQRAQGEKSVEPNGSGKDQGSGSIKRSSIEERGPNAEEKTIALPTESEKARQDTEKEKRKEKEREKERDKEKAKDKDREKAKRSRSRGKEKAKRSRSRSRRGRSRSKEKKKQRDKRSRSAKRRSRSRSRSRARRRAKSHSAASSSGGGDAAEDATGDGEGWTAADSAEAELAKMMSDQERIQRMQERRKERKMAAEAKAEAAAKAAAAKAAEEEAKGPLALKATAEKEAVVDIESDNEEVKEAAKEADATTPGEGKGTAELLAAVARAEEKLAKSVAGAKEAMTRQEAEKPEDLDAADAEDKPVDVGDSSDESQVMVRQRKKGRRKRSPTPAKGGTAVADPIEVEEVDLKADGDAERERSRSQDDKGTAKRIKSSGDQPERSQDQQGDSDKPIAAEVGSDSDVNMSDMDLSDVEEAIARRAEKRKATEAAAATEGGEGTEPGAEEAAEEERAADPAAPTSCPEGSGARPEGEGPAARGASAAGAGDAPEQPEEQRAAAGAEAAAQPLAEEPRPEAGPTVPGRSGAEGMIMAGFLSSVLGGKVAAPRMEAPAAQEEQAEAPAPSPGEDEDALCALTVSQLQHRLRAKAIVMPPKLAAAADGDKLAAVKLAALLRAAGDDGAAQVESKKQEEDPPKDEEGHAQADGKQQPPAADCEPKDGDEPTAAGDTAGTDDMDMDAFMSEIADLEAGGALAAAEPQASGDAPGASEAAPATEGTTLAADDPEAKPAAAAEDTKAGAARVVSDDAFAAFMQEIDFLSAGDSACEAAPGQGDGMDTAASALPEEPPAATAEDAAAAAPDQPLSLRFVPQRRAWVVACPGLREEEKVFCLGAGAIEARRAALRYAERCEQRLKAEAARRRAPEVQKAAEEQSADPEAQLLQALADNEEQQRAKISFSLSKKPPPDDKSAEAQLLQAIADEEKLKQKEQEQDLDKRAGLKETTSGQQEPDASSSRACRGPYAGPCDSLQILQTIANGRAPPGLAKEQFEKYRPVHPFQLHWRICLHRGRPAMCGDGFGAGDLLGPTGLVVSCPSRGTVARLRRQTDPLLRQEDEAELQKKMQRLHSLRDRLTAALAKPSAAKQTEVSMRRALEQTEAGITAAQASADELIDRSWARRAERVAIFCNVGGQSCRSSQNQSEGGELRLRGLTVLPDADRSGALPALLLLAFLRPLSCGARGGCSALCDLDTRQVRAISVFGHTGDARWVLPLSRRRRLGLGDLARANRLRAAISAALLQPAGTGGAAVLRECPEIARALGELVVGLGQQRPAFEVDDRVSEVTDGAAAEPDEAPAALGKVRRRRFGDVWIDLQEDGVDWDDVLMEPPPAVEEPPEEPPAEPEEEEDAHGGGFFSFDVSVEELSRRREASGPEEEAAEEGGSADSAPNAGEETVPPPPPPKEPAALSFLPELTLLRELRERAERFGQMRAEAKELVELCRNDAKDGKKHARALVEAARDVEEALDMARQAWEAACAVESKEGAGKAMALATSTMQKVGALMATITDSTARLEQVRLAAKQRETRAKEGSADAPQLWGVATKVLKRAREGLDERWEKIVAVRTSVEGSQRKALTRADDSIALVNERLQRWADEERILQDEDKLVQQGRHPTQRRDPAEVQAQWKKATEQDRQDAQARAEAQQQELFARQQRMLQQQWGMGESAQPLPDIIYTKPPPS